jgi:hypothetical protein
MMADREQILLKCDEHEDGILLGGDNEIIAYDGKIQVIWDAMDEYMKVTCLELLQYLAKYHIKCSMTHGKEPVFMHGNTFLTKEQLFENFL